MTESVHRWWRPLDVAVVGLVLAAGVWWSRLALKMPPGRKAVVWVDGKRTAWMDLDAASSRLTVSVRGGEVVLEQRRGEVRVVSSPCAGKICIHQGWAHRSGERLVCVPTGLVVVLEGGPREEVLDAVP